MLKNIRKASIWARLKVSSEKHILTLLNQLFCRLPASLAELKVKEINEIMAAMLGDVYAGTAVTVRETYATTSS